MAEALLRAAGGDIEVGSAGVAAMDGDRVSGETVAVLKDAGVEMGEFRSRMVQEGMLESADLIIPMTGSHAHMLLSYFPEFERKVKLMCDFIDESEGLGGADIPDPIGMGMAAYREVAEVMKLAIPGIKEELK